MKVIRFMFGMAAVLCLGTSAQALIIIPTNQNGADTEIREEDTNATALAPTVIATAQRGNSNELATRGQNTNIETDGDKSSMMFMKFDISGLPNHNSNPGFWSNMNVFFKGYIRNTNLSDSRIFYPTTTGLPEAYRVNFDIRGLEPGHVYADDDISKANRVDRSNRNYTSPHYEYDWDEGDGTVGSGITYLDAPGITPFCTLRGSCDTTTFGGANTNIFQSEGLFDDYNSDTRFLGNWKWARPTDLYPGSNRYPVGLPVEYTDTNGNLKQLVFDAQDAGRSKVTLILNLAVDPQLDTSSNPGATPPVIDGPDPGIFPNNTFLNHNYLFIPKEKTLLENDNNWDPDGSGTQVATGSPWSCDGLMGAGITNCGAGHTPPVNPPMTLGVNNGQFSPQLIVKVPEPSSLLLLVLGSLVVGASRRRK